LPVNVVVIDGDPPLDADRFLTPTIELDEALRRVRLDPARRLSKDPVFLRRHYNVPRVQRGLVIDTSTVSIAEAACAIADYAE
jgi:hypothetical protein